MQLDIDVLLGKADRAARAGEFEQANALLERALSVAPSAQTWADYSWTLSRSGRHAEARHAAEQALRLDDHLADGFFRLGVALFHLERLADAADALRRGLAIEERQPLLTILGNALRRLGDRPGATEVLQRSLALRSNDVEAHVNLALVMSETDLAAAVPHFEAAYKADPRFPGLKREYGHTLHHVGREDESEYLLRAAVLDDPIDSWARCYLGNRLLAKGDLDGAQNAYRAAVQLDDQVGYFRACLASVAERRGLAEIAERLFAQALDVDPDSALSNAAYGTFLERHERPERALIYLERAIAVDPENVAARAALMRVKTRLSESPPDT